MRPERALRQARGRVGFSQRRLAEAAGVPQSTVGRIESGAIDPRASTLDQLLRACGYELHTRPRLGAGVDRSVIRERLRHTPRRRIEDAARAGEQIALIRHRRRAS